MPHKSIRKHIAAYRRKLGFERRMHKKRKTKSRRQQLKPIITLLENGWTLGKIKEMETLSKTYGAENVRMVIWID